MRAVGRGFPGLLILEVVFTTVVPTIVAHGASRSCGISDGHTLCVSAPARALSGRVKITVSNSPNDGRVIVTWVPRAGTTRPLITAFAPSPETGDYSFWWPTRKYLDASGKLHVQYGSTSSERVGLPVTLSNGNATHVRHTHSDWRTFLPRAWAADTDPVVAAVGDGPSGEIASNAVAQSIATADPALFLFLGDIYEGGTFTENLNHYGVSAMDDPAGATLWGVTTMITQPTVGNHEAKNLAAWRDYWHGHPAHLSFRFGGVLFLDLDAMSSFAIRSTQYKFVKDSLSSAPRCVVAFWHHPVLWGDVVDASRQPIWKLLANHGGDLVLNGHHHSMAVYEALDANFRPGGHMVEIVSGAGGHNLGGAATDSLGRLQWTKGRTAGALYLTLKGAAGHGVATSISWTFKDAAGNPLPGSSASVDC